jgi:hypothetical protein
LVPTVIAPSSSSSDSEDEDAVRFQAAVHAVKDRIPNAPIVLALPIGVDNIVEEVSSDRGMD